MSLLVEDGTGLPSADAYASVAAVTAYHAAFGNDSWADFDSTQQEILIRRATRDLDALYGAGYASTRLTPTQSLMFPRASFCTDDGVKITGIPAALVSAVSELALIEGTIDPTGTSDTSGNDKVSIIRIGDIWTHTEKFSQTSANGAALRKVSFLLRSLLIGGAASLFVPISRG